MICSHFDQISEPMPAEAAKEGAVCEDCVKIGSTWIHLRICRSCGYVGCCDSSPKRHARRHWHDEDHPLISSMEKGEAWTFCFEDKEEVDAR
ncbi:MAG: UBP-type zinc finger domain-containing protein [Pacificimonas sp.]